MLTDHILTTQDDNEYETHKVLEQDKGEKSMTYHERDREKRTQCKEEKDKRPGVDIYTNYLTLVKR